MSAKLQYLFCRGENYIELRHENLSSGFATRLDSNRPAQQQKLVRFLKFWI